MFLPCSKSVQSLVCDNSTHLSTNPPHLPPKETSQPPSLSIPMPQNYLRLTSSLRSTSLLWFSSVPSNHCLQSNLTLKPEGHILLLKIILRFPHTGSNSSPCSLTQHNSTILNRYRSPKLSMLSLFFVLLSNLFLQFVEASSTVCLPVD